MIANNLYMQHVVVTLDSGDMIKLFMVENLGVYYGPSDD